jgi:beta-mannosidase
MLRVWGGGIFETDDFYDICDEMGVLVWQDFLFACAMYPEEEPFKSEVEAEARYNVARLAHHPSLAIWNGCNENIWAYRDWGWKDSEEVKGRTWGLGYYLDLLPRVVNELTPTIPYWAASPWSGDPDPDNGIHPNADTHGNMHVWKPWFREDYLAYREFQARFCSEFGFQGPATYSSIASVVPPEARDFGSVEMRHRQKSGDRVRDDGDRRNLRHLIRISICPARRSCSTR